MKIFALIARLFFWLLVFSLPFVQPFFVVLFGKIVPATDFIFPAVFLFWFLAVIFRQINLKIGWFYLPPILYFFALALATIFAENQRESFIKLCAEAYLIGLAVIAYTLADSTRFLRQTAYVWLAAATISALVVWLTATLFYVDRNHWLLIHTLSHYGSLPPGNYPRIKGTFLNANMLCNYLNASLMFGLIALAKWRWLLVAWLLIFGVAALFTVAPGLGGLFLCAGVWLWLWLGKQNKLAQASLICGIALACLFFLSTLIAPDSSNGKLAPSVRVLVWQDSLKTFSENLLTGRGVGADAASVDYRDASGNIQTLNDAHQSWLNVAAQAGLPGLAAFLFLTVYFARKVFPLEISSEAARWRVGLALAFCGAFIYQGLGGSFEDARHLWVLIGLLGAAGVLQETEKTG